MRIAIPDKFRNQVIKLLSFLGPGFLITVGFIDPGNWASNLAAGADYGYALLKVYITMIETKTYWFRIYPAPRFLTAVLTM